MGKRRCASKPGDGGMAVMPDTPLAGAGVSFHNGKPHAAPVPRNETRGRTLRSSLSLSPPRSSTASAVADVLAVELLELHLQVVGVVVGVRRDANRDPAIA